jgi:hypothetical protein
VDNNPIRFDHLLEDLAARLDFGSEAVGERKAFGFEAAKERFDPGIIITVTLSAHALQNSKGPQLLAYRSARILATPIGVENQTVGRLSKKRAF